MITSSANKVIIAGNGAQTSFAFGFVGAAAVDIYAIYTDANGNETELAQGPGPTQFQVSLNAATAGSLWGVGGSVTYNPGGTPIAAGTTLTIYRDVAYTQGVSLQNQASFGQYAQAAETAMDLLEMQIQQIAEAQARVLSAPIVDPSTINLTLPPAAQRANTGLAFDSEGNVIAGTTPATGLISTAMQPVVDAASIPDALALLGIGTIATLTPNYGLQESVSGANNLDVNFATVQDAANQTAVAAFHMTQRFATGALSYTLPKASTLWNGFGFVVTALTAPITFVPNAADNFAGLASGQSFTIPVGSTTFITTNGAGSGTWWLRGLQATGLNSPLNLRLNASVSANALTIALKDDNDLDPSSTSPILVAFPDPTVANGDVLVAAITGALALTVPSGEAAGTPGSSVPFKLWVGLVYNGGTPAIALYQSVTGGATPTMITPWDETAQISTTALTGGAATAATWYSASAIADTSVRIIGYLEFGSGQATAGVWANDHTKARIFGPGVRKPGDRVNYALKPNGAYATTANTYTPSASAPTPAGGAVAVSQAWTAASPTNVVKLRGQVVRSNNNGSEVANFLYDGTTVLAVNVLLEAGGGFTTSGPSWFGMSKAANVTYSLYYCGCTGGTTYLNGYSGTGYVGGLANTFLEVEEIAT
ncbi:MAG TPA: hypothetical protein VHY10_08780 [Xanthobacteraceae bacterium]|nr:hypothetical protein [Xanthobacteraceae bacterium]